MKVDIRHPTPVELIMSDFHGRAMLKGFAILLDGYMVDAVVAFDTDEGWVEHFIRDEHGRLVHDGAGNALLTKVHGHVTVMLPRHEPAEGEIEVINPQPELRHG